MNHENLVSFRQRSDRYIAQGALTNSKRPSCFVDGVYPTHFNRAQGCYLWTPDGKRYIDFVCGLGANLLGYARKEINEAVKSALDKGNLYSLASTIEVDFAESIHNYFPLIEQIKVLKSGTTGCDAAIRIARAHTKKSLVYSDGYHGHSDDFVSLTPPACGVPGKRDWIHKYEAGVYLKDAAAVIVEPVITDYSQQRIEELKALRAECTLYGALLIFDCTITALRFPGMSFSQWSGIKPDLIVMGKALGNGLPISIVGGSAKIMSGSEYFISTTYAGDTLPMVAAMKVLPLVKEGLQAMWDAAERFQTDFNTLAPDTIRLDGYPMRGVLWAKDDLIKALFMQEMCKAGVLFGSSWFWCEPHSYEAPLVLELVKVVVQKIKNNGVKLEGKLPKKPFAQQQRDKE